MLSAAGLVTEGAVVSARTPPPRPPMLVSRAALVAVCNASDGPDWLAAPIGRTEGGVLTGALLRSARIWRSPADDYRYRREDRQWVKVRDYAIFSCADFRQGA